MDKQSHERMDDWLPLFYFLEKLLDCSAVLRAVLLIRL